jgi:PAS domain S-box-containing protein
MHPALLVPLFACIASAMLAAALLSHDADQRANRLIAAVLVCCCWWSLCEVLWNVQDDARVVVWLVRASGAGWIWLGPLSMHLYTEFAADARSPVRRALPAAYATAATSLALYLGTPWCVTGAVPTAWGWGYRFGPLFPPVYLTTLGWIGLALAHWPQLLVGASPRERRQAVGLLVGVAAPLTLASLTDVILPGLGVHVPRLGSASLLVTGTVAAWGVRNNRGLLLASGAFAAEMLEALRDGVALVLPDGRVRSCNPALCRIAGLEADALAGRRVAELLPGLPRRPAALAAGPARAEEDALHDLATELVPAQGDPIPVSVSSSLLRDSRRVPVGEVLAIHDLSDVASLRSRLVTSGRLAAVGELAAGIAHEIASPISWVRASLAELRRHWQSLAAAAEQEDLREELAEILAEGEDLIGESVEGVDRVARIVRDVGAFAHAGRGRAEPLDVNGLLEQVLGVAVLSFSVVVERCYAELPPVACDPQQLKQVFLNLLLNARQAVGDYGRIRIQTGARDGWVSIRIEDDGPGIPEDAIDRVFDPFFTTRPAEGVGLGLAHCHEILRAWGGTIGVSSKPGFGAAFEVRLPEAGRGAAPDGA